MMNTIENYFFNVFAGKIAARLVVTIVAALSSAAVKPLLAQFGLAIEINQAELTTGMIGVFHAVFEWFKARRAANPNSVVVQTDSTKPGADLSAVAVNAPK